MESPSCEDPPPPKLSGAEIREAFLQYYESQVGLLDGIAGLVMDMGAAGVLHCMLAAIVLTMGLPQEQADVATCSVASQLHAPSLWAGSHAGTGLEHSGGPSCIGHLMPGMYPPMSICSEANQARKQYPQW